MGGDCQKGNIIFINNAFIGEECVYRHITNTEKRSEDCPFYERGFCKKGLACSFDHIQEYICENYAYGFCPKGPTCDKIHLKSVIADNDTSLKILASVADKDDWQDKNAIS